MRKLKHREAESLPKVVHGGTRILAFQLLSLGSQPLWVSVSSTSPATLAMDQPAGLQVDYVFRGVEHAVRVMVSGQVLELEVEDRMTADQWRGEFDANWSVPAWVGSPVLPQSQCLPEDEASLDPAHLPLLPDQSSLRGRVCRTHPSGQRHWCWGKVESLGALPLGWARGRSSGRTFLST